MQADLHAFKYNRHLCLLLYNQTVFSQCNNQRILIDRFQKARPECFMDMNGSADYSLRYLSVFQTDLVLFMVSWIP